MNGRDRLEARDHRDAEIVRLKRELKVSREREITARAEAKDARTHFANLSAVSKRFAWSMRSGAAERQQHRRRLAAQYAVGDVLAKAGDLAEAAPQVFEILGERLGWDVGALWTPDAEAGVMRRAGIWRRAGAEPGAFEEACEKTSIRRGEGLPGRVWERGEPVWVEDVAEDVEAPARRAAAAEDDLHGAFAFPIRNGGLVGVLELLRREALPPDEDLMRTAVLVGNQIGQFIERRRAEEAVRVAAEQVRFRIDLADALRPLLAPSEIQAEAARFLGKHLGANRVVYAEVEGDEDGDAVFAVVEGGYASGVPPLTGRFRMADFGLAPTTPSRSDTVVVTDVASETGLTDDERARYAGAGIGAWVGVPLVKAGRFVATLGVHQREPRAWTPQEITLIEETAERAWAAMERARAEEALRESEERLQLALDASAMGSFLYHVEEDRGEPDARMLALFGLPEDGTLNLAEALARLIHPDDRAGYEEAVARATDPGGDGTLNEEIRVQHPDGAERSVAVTGRVQFEDGRAVRMAGVAADVTERRRAEVELRKSEERFRALVGQGADMITISDYAGRITYASPTTERVSGYAPEEFVALDPFDSIHPDDRARCVDALQRLVDEPGLSLDLQHRVKHKDGDWRWVEGTFTSLFHEPAIGGLVANVRDITARVRAEEGLRASEERYRSLVTATSSIVWTAAPNGECVAPMPSWEEFTGQTFEEYRGFNWLSAVHPDDRPPTNAWDDLDPEEEAPLVVEYRLRRRDGEYRRVVSRAVPVLDSSGEVREWVGTVSDVEEKRRVEEANAYLASVVRSAGQAVIGLSPDGVIESWNPAAEKLFGYPAREAIGRSISRVNGPGQRAEKDAIVDALKSRQIASFETVRVAKDGRRVEVLVDVSPVVDAEGHAAGFSATVADISQRKRAERALRRSEERYRSLFESIDEGFCVIEMVLDADGEPADYRFLETNPSFEKQTGLRDVSGKMMRELAPDLDRYWFEVYGKVALSGEPVRFAREEEALGNRWFDVYAFKLGGPESRKVAIVFSDISERRRSEEERERLRREAEVDRARLEAVLQQMPGGIFIADLSGEIFLANDGAARVYGKKLRTVEECGKHSLSYPDGHEIPPEEQTLNRALAGEDVSGTITYAVRADGARRIVSANAAPVRDAAGRVVAAIKALQDVTSRVEAEAALKESEQRLRAVVESAPVVLCSTDRDGVFTLAVGRGHEALGLEPGAAEGRSIFEVFHDNSAIQEDAVRALSGETFAATREVRGGVWESSYAPLWDEDGEVAGLTAVAVDVTGRRVAERERDLSEARELAARTAVEEAQRQLAFYAGAREERQTISRELHDRVAHSMAVVRQHLELYEVLAKRDPEAAGVKLELAKEEAKAALNNTRDLSMMLRHSEVEEGLEKALASLLETSIPYGVRYEVEVEGDESLVPTHVGNQLFLVLREAVRNATTHSGCKHLTVGLKITPRGVVGRVVDDGRGFEPRKGDDGNGLRHQGGGLRSMKERAALVGGRFVAVSRTGGGTSIEVSVPFKGDRRGDGA